MINEDVDLTSVFATVKKRVFLYGEFYNVFSTAPKKSR